MTIVAVVAVVVAVHVAPVRVVCCFPYAPSSQGRDFGGEQGLALVPVLTQGLALVPVPGLDLALVLELALVPVPLLAQWLLSMVAGRG